MQGPRGREQGAAFFSLDGLCVFISRAFGLGLCPVAPGTAGSAGAALAAPWLFLPLSMGARVALLAAIFVLGGLAATRAERVLGRKDPGEVVIDEVLGQWLAFLPFAALSGWSLALGFALFRVFDIMKPWPVRASENWAPRGFGVMLDDVLAGGYALACLAVVKAVWPAL